MPVVSDAITTTVTELPDSRVRVEATVSPKEVDARVAETARKLGQNMRVPGFRKGKVPPPVILKQLGREAVLDETVRNQLGRWYVDAVDEAGLEAIGDPDLDQLGDLPASGEDARDFPLYCQRLTFYPDVAEHEAVAELFVPLK